jgi:uncharacterized glyoxalase superfamily protein PhnB
MTGKIQYKPDGYHTVTPYLIVHDASSLIDFLKQVFDAREEQRFAQPDGSIMHAEVRIGDSVVMIADANEANSPRAGMLHIYLEDMDTVYRRALVAGATSIREPEDQFYGDRTAGVEDPFGDQLWLTTHIEDVSPEELQRRMETQAR